MSALGPTLQAFFTDRLLRERNASPLTVAAYRDTWRLLLGFVSQHTGKPPSSLDFKDLDAPVVGAFLDHLERERGNSARTRNARLAAIHSLFRYAALRHPEHADGISRVLSIQAKRFERTLVNFLTEAEVDALLAAPDRATWVGRRDRAMLLLAVQTGLRISELIGLCAGDIHLGAGSHVVCHGKGRKERITPLTSATVRALREWLAEQQLAPSSRLFPTRTGTPLSRDAVERRISLHTTAAARACPTLANKIVTAHCLRHTAAMRLLESGVDTTVIALWLGHVLCLLLRPVTHDVSDWKNRGFQEITAKFVEGDRSLVRDESGEQSQRVGSRFPAPAPEPRSIGRAKDRAGLRVVQGEGSQ